MVFNRLFSLFGIGQKKLRRSDFPDDADGDSIWSIVEGGSDINAPMDIDFFVAFENIEDGERFVPVAQEAGYVVSLEQDSEENGLGGYTCYCTKTMVLTYEAVLEEQRKLSEMSKSAKGYVDGWGTYGNVEDL